MDDEGVPAQFATVDSPLLAYLWLLRDVPDGDSVAFSLCRGLLAPFRPEACALYAATTDGEALSLVGGHAIVKDMADLYSLVPIESKLPICEVFRSMSEQFVPLDFMRENYPLAAPYLRVAPIDEGAELGVFPLVHRGVPIGVISLTFSHRVDRTWALRSAIDALQCATSLWLVAWTSLGGVAVTNGRSGATLAVSDRQQQVLSLIREGLTNRAIAARLGFAEGTIKADITAMSSLLGASGRDDLVAKAARAGL